MARKSSKPPMEELEAVDHFEGEPTNGEIEAPDRSISKAGAARAALAAGVTVPKQASVYIKQKFGIDISPQQFSAEKCRLKQRSGDPSFTPRLDLANHRGDGFSPFGQRGLGDQTGLLEALEVMKPLIDQLGADKVKRMVDLLG